MQEVQPRTFDFQELAVWSTRLPDVELAVLPASNSRPNPLATPDRLYVSVFAPGAACALDRDHGKLLWRRELPRFASSSVHLHDRKLLACTATTLWALHPDSGETLWSFCPYGNDGEWIYSSPSTKEGRLYIGDRRGFLHCLDIDSGTTIWNQCTNQAGGDVNSTPVLLHDLVIVTTNAKTAVAYEALSGKLAWTQDLNEPSTFGPVMHGRSVLIVSGSLYVLDPKTGRVQRQLSWSDRKVQQAVSTPRSIIVVLRPDIPRTEISATNVEAITAAAKELRAKTIMCVIAQSGTESQRQIDCLCPSLRYAPATRLVYLSHLGGIDVFRPSSGTFLYQLKAENRSRRGTGLVDVKDANVYALMGDGCVYALRHPAQPRRVSA
jgi:outer membrane protein assembly factor BamB